MPQRLEAAYGGRWPDTPIPVDVVVYCNPVGAYSTGGRVTISSADFGNGMPQALELIFQEASHVESLESPLTTLVQEAFRAAGSEAPESVNPRERDRHPCWFVGADSFWPMLVALHELTGRCGAAGCGLGRLPPWVKSVILRKFSSCPGAAHSEE